MRRPHLILGLLLLGGAAAVGFYTSQPDAPTNRRATAGDSSRQPGAGRASTALAPDQRGRVSHPQTTPATALRIEAVDLTNAGHVIRARDINAAAHTRLELLTEQLDISPAQQRRIFPLLARSNPGFDNSLNIIGGIHLGPPGRISKATADEFIRDLLDPDQQLEMEFAAAEDDVWWTQVIAKLEQDLVDATSPAAATAPPPETPAPPASDQPRTAPREHRGSNLFDRMESEDP